MKYPPKKRLSKIISFSHPPPFLPFPQGDKYLKKVMQEILKELGEYRGQRKYKNPPLSYFRLDKAELDQKYAEYIKFMGL